MKILHPRFSLYWALHFLVCVGLNAVALSNFVMANRIGFVVAVSMNLVLCALLCVGNFFRFLEWRKARSKEFPHS